VKLRLAIWMALMLVHFLAGLVAWKGGNEFLGPLVAASVYLPLWPLEALGLPLTQGTGAFFPPPTLLGWGVVVVVWAAVYWLIAVLAEKFGVRSRRRGQRS
jgi:hypothetical protein